MNRLADESFPFSFSLATVVAYVQWRTFRRLTVWWELRDRNEAMMYEDLTRAEFSRFADRLLAEPWWETFARGVEIPEGVNPDVERVRGGIMRVLDLLGAV